MRIEIRSDSVIVDGYVNSVGRESRIMPSNRGKFVEEIVPKTFQKALMKASNVYLLFNHAKDKVLGSTSTGELELREDNIGLRAIATITCPEVIQKAREGKLRGWSFGMYCNKDRWEERSDGMPKRFVEDLELIEVSLLDKQPAYWGTSVEVRGEEEVQSEIRVLEFDPVVVQTEEKKEEEVRTTYDNSSFENEITILKMKGSQK